MPKFYHFTSLNKLHEMFDMNYSVKEPAIVPIKRMVTLDAPLSKRNHKMGHEGAVFGVLDPFESGWWDIEFNPDEPMMERVIKEINGGHGPDGNEIIVLEIEVDDDDPVYVADWSVHEHPEYNGYRADNKDLIRDIKDAYVESMVPLSEYLEKGMDYRGAEVLCFTHIPLKKDRVKIIHQENRHDLINRMRIKFGREPHPPQLPYKEPDLSVLFDGEPT